MATTRNNKAAVSPQDCKVGDLMWDIRGDVPGVVVGHHGEDGVRLRAINGGKEWGAKAVRRPTPHEELRHRNAARNATSSWGL
ncbi:hypothetical protein [Streptomyces niveus]|uniref:hypothetical protein n=1 Tax=Streptomyces niveus TaxID=193462 RepID=UPI0035D707A3